MKVSADLVDDADPHLDGWMSVDPSADLADHADVGCVAEDCWLEEIYPPISPISQMFSCNAWWEKNQPRMT
jgi:hypothetical protein